MSLPACPEADLASPTPQSLPALPSAQSPPRVPPSLLCNPDALSPSGDGITLADDLPPSSPPVQFFHSDRSGRIVPNWLVITAASKQLAGFNYSFSTYLNSLASTCYETGSELRSIPHLKKRDFNLTDDFLGQIGHGGTGMRLDVLSPVPSQLPLPARSTQVTPAEREEEREKFEMEMTLCSRGYSIVLLSSVATRIPNLRISPFFLKARPGKSSRPLHDLSSRCLDGPSGPTSVNACTDITSLPDLKIGSSLMDLLSFTYSLSMHFPGQERVLWKFDLAGAFFLFHVRPEDCPFFAYHIDAEQKLIVIPCRVTQGSRFGSHICGGFTRSICEMASSRSSVGFPWVPSPPRAAPPEPVCGARVGPQQEVPFDPLHHLGSLSPDRAHKLKDYIDDVFAVGLSSMFSGAYRMSVDTIYSAFRGLFASEAAFRRCPISQDKFGDAAGTWVKEILGMILDVHSLTISVKPQRCTDTISRIDSLLSTAGGSSTQFLWDAKEVERIVGVLSFVATYRPRGRAHTKMLTNMLSLSPVTTRRGRSVRDKPTHLLKATAAEVQQLRDWRLYLLRNTPVPIKHLVPRSPTHLGGSDAAGEVGTGAGGWHIVKGVAHLWRLEFPPEVISALTRVAGEGTVTIGDLEFFAVILNVMVWVASCTAQGLVLDNLVIHSVCDNIAACAWIRGKGPASRASLFLAKVP